MHRYRPLVFFGLAAVIALITSALIYAWLRSHTAEVVAAVPAFTTTDVAVAAADLPWGTPLRPEMIKVVRYPSDTVPPGHFRDAAALQDRVLLMAVKQHEPILESKLAPTSARGGVSAVMDPDKRAMAVKVDDVIGVAGFIKPGDRVDVMVTVDHRTGYKRPVAKVILENVKVLATGAEMVRSGNHDEPTPVHVMTLEVSVPEAEKLALASTQGQLRLALRNPLNAEPILTHGASVRSLLGSYRPAPEPRPRRAQAPRETEQVEVIKGGQVIKSPK